LLLAEVCRSLCEASLRYRNERNYGSRGAGFIGCYWVASVPFIPASSRPGSPQKNAYVPRVLMVKVPLDF
jgi:hypothetical protein